jgi:hypothetical protein
MSLPLAVIALVLLLVGMALYAKLVSRLFDPLRRTLQQRGYKSPAVLTGWAAAAFALPFLFALTYAQIVGSKENALWWLILAFLAVPLALASAVRFLPARNPRTAGRRVVWFPYRPAGHALLAGTVLLWIGGQATGKNGFFQVGVAFAIAGIRCLAIARRAVAPDASAVLAADPRPPVLYLRPFQQEEESFAEVAWRWRDSWTIAKGRITSRRKGWLTLTLEQYLGREVSARLGPFLALGNPIDFVPPEGAARWYVPDDEWTKHFEALVRRARCIIAMAAVSENVLWELTQVRLMGLEWKLFVLTKPKLTPKATVGAWSPFADALGQAGWQPCRDDPGPGAAIAFDGRGQAIVIKRDARNATELVDALCGRVGSYPSVSVNPSRDRCTARR